MTEALITPELVRWARERHKLNTQTAAEKLHVASSKFIAWETGDARPTLRQAQNLARKLSVPFGYLFLSTPPVEELPLPDLRTVAGTPPRTPSPELSDLLDDVLRKQQWYREYQENQKAIPIPFIGRFTLDDNVETVALDIMDTLGIDDDMRREAETWEHFMRLFVRKSESAGVLVLRSGIVGNNTYRKLDVREFRGFAISDGLAPLVFINGRDAKVAQIFTLAHELAHLWIGESGISNLDYMQRSIEQQNHIDRFCDRVAAQTLVPNEDFLLHWQNERDIDRNLQSLAARYRVSALVILRRAYENEKLSFSDYQAKFQELVETQRPRGGDGGNFYTSLLARNSSTLTLTLLTATAEGDVSYRDAARLLNVRAKTLGDIRTFLGSVLSNA